MIPARSSSRTPALRRPLDRDEHQLAAHESAAHHSAEAGGYHSAEARASRAGQALSPGCPPVSESHLPDDPAEWPSDPYRLLGVDRSVDRPGLRRAYARLIRTYRPEHCPDQFRRIRAAYERLEASLRYRRLAGNPSPMAPGRPSNAAAQRPRDAHGASNIETQSPLDAAWELPAAGKPSRLTAGCGNWSRRTGQRGALPAAVLVVGFAPRLGPRPRPPRVADCRIVGRRPREPALRALRPGVGRRPARSAVPVMPRSVGAFGDAQRAGGAGGACWAQLGLAGRWNVMAQDLQGFRGQLAAADSTAWVRMLLACEEQLRWQTDQKACGPLAQACRREIEEHSEEHQRLTWELDHGDFADAPTAGLRKLAPSGCLPAETARRLADILRRGWVHPLGMIREDLLAVPVADGGRSAPSAGPPRPSIGPAPPCCTS